jgi:hypothetical protein
VHRDDFLRRVLKTAAFFNLAGGLAFAFPGSIGSLMGLPSPVPPVYAALVTWFVVLFAGVYAWVALQPTIHPAAVALAAIGKAGAFALFLICWLAGTASGPERRRSRRRPRLRRDLRMVAARPTRADGGGNRAMTTTESNDVTVIHPAIAVAGRVMFTLIFFLSGITHFTGMADYVALMPQAIPFREFWVADLGRGRAARRRDDPHQPLPAIGRLADRALPRPGHDHRARRGDDDGARRAHAGDPAVVLPEGRDDDRRSAPHHPARRSSRVKPSDDGCCIRPLATARATRRLDPRS